MVTWYTLIRSLPFSFTILYFIFVHTLFCVLLSSPILSMFSYALFVFIYLLYMYFISTEMANKILYYTIGVHMLKEVRGSPDSLMV